MNLFLRCTCLPIVLCLVNSLSIAQMPVSPSASMQLNGVLYQVILDADDKPQSRYLWSLELQELSRNYSAIESGLGRKRVNTVFFAETSGREWRQMWNSRIRDVYENDAVYINDHAEAFFSISNSFPTSFREGDEFSLEYTPEDEVTRAYLNDILVAQTLKPEHFNFWLRAWYTGVAMPETFRGNLLAGGAVPDDLMIAFLNSAPPAPVRQSLAVAAESENIVRANVVPVIVGASVPESLNKADGQ